MLGVIGSAFTGPDMAKFAIALREIGTYKEVLRSQVERVASFVAVDLVLLDPWKIQLLSLQCFAMLIQYLALICLNLAWIVFRSSCNTYTET